MKKSENMTHKEVKNQSKKLDPEISEMIELVNQDLLYVCSLYGMHKNLKKNLYY